MWIAAHPDDEAVAAPLLASWCREPGARCALVVLTRGEAGACLLPGGCSPDIATVRGAEAAAASEYFRADSILLRLPDGGGSAAPSWPRDAVIRRIAGEIDAFAPDAVLTFDPRHGTTCHPDHRLTGELVLAAVERVPTKPEVHLLETFVTIELPFAIRFAPATSEASWFDANTTLGSTGAAAWNAVIDDMRRHPSQFDERWIRAVSEVAPQERAVWFAPASVLARPLSTACR
ncbi:MAG TPA: PIG-L family deacetylase [Thermoanaerobaculia bacterium]|nr:PIG-L family deacetylase [Thermoanaerobaculia bacterium]